MSLARSGFEIFWNEKHMYYGRCIFESEKSVLTAHKMKLKRFSTYLCRRCFVGIKVERVDGRRIQVGKWTLYRISREALKKNILVFG